MYVNSKLASDMYFYGQVKAFNRNMACQAIKASSLSLAFMVVGHNQLTMVMTYESEAAVV